MTLRSLCLLTLSCAAILLSGCGEDYANITPLADQQQFENALKSDKPVLMDFYKDSCPTCVIQEAVINDMAPEYMGKVDFVKYKILESNFSPASKAIKDRYKLNWVPTTMLFVNGQEVKRWELNHGADEFRTALDEVLARPTAAKPAAAPITTAGKLPANWDANNKKCIEGQGCPIE
ncbi:MAG: thioredoxin family protein [Planctomycetaceae bacterium]|nr:thioredoxin family protein [Planctomycetaceae bacterium]